MITKTFNGCKIKVVAGRGRDSWGQMTALVNGEPFSVVERHDEAKAVAEIERTLASIHAAPVDGNSWPAHYYPPGAYEICEAGIHPREVGGQCTHMTCRPAAREQTDHAFRSLNGAAQCVAIIGPLNSGQACGLPPEAHQASTAIGS